MTESSRGKYNFTKPTIRNRCKKLKAEYASVTEMLNASGFGFDNNTHRVVADDEIWAEWLKGHPKANTCKSRTIDYEKLSMVFGRDIATGQFARFSVNATTGNTEPTTQGNTNMSGNMDIAIEDMRMSSSGCGGSCSASRNKKRARGMSEFMVGFKASSHEIREAIDGVIEKMVDPTKRLPTIVYKELKMIENLSEEDIEIAHEWLNAHLDKAAAFIDIDNKRAWIVCRMQRIREFATA